MHALQMQPTLLPNGHVGFDKSTQRYISAAEEYAVRALPCIASRVGRVIEAGENPSACGHRAPRLQRVRCAVCASKVHPRYQEEITTAGSIFVIHVTAAHWDREHKREHMATVPPDIKKWMRIDSGAYFGLVAVAYHSGVLRGGNVVAPLRPLMPACRSLRRSRAARREQLPALVVSP